MNETTILVSFIAKITRNKNLDLYYKNNITFGKKHHWQTHIYSSQYHIY